MTSKITISPITRLEGHGKIDIILDDAGDVADCFFQVVELLIHSNKCTSLLGPMTAVHDPPSTCLHLAARNGHEHVVRSVVMAMPHIHYSIIIHIYEDI